MGNSHSSNNSPTKRWFSRKRPTIFSRITSTRISAGSSIHSSEASHETVVAENEKAHYSGDHVRTSSEPLPVTVAYTPAIEAEHGDAAAAYNLFIEEFPEYKLTWILDTLRRTDFRRLDRAGETYVDYMGGSLYPESLIRAHTNFLSHNVLGNTHSVSNSSKLSLKYADEAREAVLSFFKASPDYTVVFTANASGALKLVGESYPFTGGSSYLLGTDSHNSVHGIREYATCRGAQTIYIPSTPNGGMESKIAKNMLLKYGPRSKELGPSLFALTGQSNISNSKNSLELIEYASTLGYNTLLDAAALAPTTTFSISECPVDAMAVSFYKMFGYPTGVGALIIKKSFLVQLKRPWFSGGTVDVVQVPGTIVTRAHELHERFEDGTINYLMLPAVTDGLRFLTAYLPFLPLRLSSLMHYLVDSLLRLKHDVSQTPVVRILSRRPVRRLRFVGDQADAGSVVSLVFLDPSGEMIPNSFIEYSASQKNVSLRTGCMCNPGGAASLLGIEEDMKRLYPGVTLVDFENVVGRELGVVRISLGLASNFQDVWRVIEFASSIAREETRRSLWDLWVEASGAKA
ncbi:pyridoxal phosphate-dependent transferase [Cyathus striatus]|nr:pyridoxal phosphate-dependent transferase [Cyathus striatus]